MELKKIEREDDDFEAMCALIVKADADAPVIDNLKRRLRAPVSSGGCQLLVKVVRKPASGKKGKARTVSAN